MNKIQMAHDWAMKYGSPENFKLTVDEAWEYADAMQAEADKRNNKKRPDVLCEVDWRLAPNDAIGWMLFDGSSTWLGESGFLIENAPSFGFTGTHLVERP